MPDAGDAGAGRRRGGDRAGPLTTPAADSIDAVVDRVTGLHIDRCAPRPVARVVHELLTNEPMRQGMGLAGRDRAITRYNWARIATETSRAYQRVLPR